MPVISNYPAAPGFKTAGTSAEAAFAVREDAAKLRGQCLLLLHSRDLTADELAELIGKSVLSIRPRVSELHTQKLIFKATHFVDGQRVFTRRKNASGMNATVWSTKRKEQGELL